MSAKISSLTRATSLDLQADIVPFVDSSDLTMSPTGTTKGITAGNLVASMAFVNVKNYGATGDGVTNDKAVITAAFAASNHLFFPAGTYFVGSVSAAENIFGEINGSGGPVTIATDGLVKFVCNTTDSSIPVFFSIRNAVGVQIGDLSFEDTGFDAGISFKGASGVDLHVTDGNPISAVTINSIHATSMVSPFRIVGKSTTRCTGVRIGLLYCVGTLYGPNLANQGDSVKIDMIYASAVTRSSFVYGVEGYEATIYSASPTAASGDCMIASGIDTGYDTTGIKIRYSSRNTSNATALVACQAFGENSRRIENLDLDLDVDSSTGADVLSFRAYNADGSVENTGATNNVFDAVKVRGRVSSTGDHAHIYCQPSTKGSLCLLDGFTQSKIDASIHTYFNHTKGLFASLLFTPVIKGTSDVGAGTYSTQLGRYQIVGSRLFFEINLVWSAHTGTGNMFIDDLPFNSSASSLVSPLHVVYDLIVVGAGKEIGAAVQVNDNIINLYMMDQAGGALALLPIDTAGSLYIAGHYEITPGA